MDESGIREVVFRKGDAAFGFWCYIYVPEF